MNERRKSQRFKIKNDPLIVHSNYVGRLEDISMGGLCCSCIYEDFDPEAHSKIDIRCKNSCLEDFGIRIKKKKITTGASFFNLFTRKCHVQFDALSDDQMSQLNSFIAKHAVT